jgi:prophage antirepressor-like protein
MADAIDEISALMLGALSGQPKPRMPTKPTPNPAMTPLIAIFQEKSIRILGTVEDPLFSAADVAAHISDSANYARVVNKYTPGEYTQRHDTIDANGRTRLTCFLTEAGLYKYLLQAKGEKAENFQRFVYKLLKEERKRTVDAIQLELKITQSLLLKAEQHQEALCRTANEVRDRNAQLTKQNKKLLRQKHAAADAEFLRSMGRGHLIVDAADEPSSKEESTAEEEDN